MGFAHRGLEVFAQHAVRRVLRNAPKEKFFRVRPIIGIFERFGEWGAVDGDENNLFFSRNGFCKEAALLVQVRPIREIRIRQTEKFW